MTSQFLLDRNHLGALQVRLSELGWIEPGELVVGAEKAGEGNMNCTLRVQTTSRTFILKQARAWVEKYPQIAAPVERAAAEAAFYRATENLPEISAHMPRLEAFDADDRLLRIEDLGQAEDCTFVYEAPTRLEARDLDILTEFLLHLHGAYGSLDAMEWEADFSNRAMRALNHIHIFDLPLKQNNGLDLDALTPGLDRAAQTLVNDRTYVETVAGLGEIYLGNSGTRLLHGDYFPGSWLKLREKIFVIDPEFCFIGRAEWDLGIMLAHLMLAGFEDARISVVQRKYVANGRIELSLARQFAGVEIMRRLIGVAQLPLNCGLERKEYLLQLSYSLILRGGDL